MNFLGPQWRIGRDGMRWRRAARVLVFDGRERLLLARGHDPDNPTRHWWFTIGGGIETGESARQAAVREMKEETGIELPPGSLQGPVLRRSAIFDFAAETVRQEEEFFLARLERAVSLDTSGWSSIERHMIDELRWWPLPDLAEHPEQVYPEGLAAIAADLLNEWDGTVLELGQMHDPY